MTVLSLPSGAIQAVRNRSQTRGVVTASQKQNPKPPITSGNLQVFTPARVVSAAARRGKYGRRRKSSGGRAAATAHQPLFVAVQPDGSDAWRLEPVLEILRNGGIGIIPTDTLPAVVCDSGNKEAVEKLYIAKEINPKKPLSILVGGFSHIGTYTLGFPANNTPGARDTFTLAKRILPGPFTFILPASKDLPKQCVDYESGKSRQRRHVGVRWADNQVCQAILEGLERPLLCSSMHIEGRDGEKFELPDAMSLMESYSLSGIDFMVDSGRHVAEESTIVDMTGELPLVVREGKGDPSVFR